MGSRTFLDEDLMMDDDDLETFTLPTPEPASAKKAIQTDVPKLNDANRKAEDYWKQFHTKMTAATGARVRAAQPVSSRAQTATPPSVVQATSNRPFAFGHAQLEASAAPKEPQSTTSVRTDEDGDVVMGDIEDPATIQTVSDAVLVSRYKTRGTKGLESIHTKPGGRIARPSCVFVLDTSFILTHQRLVAALAAKHDDYKVVVVFPWTTIQELDGISKGHNPDLDVVSSSSLGDSKHAPGNAKNLVPGLARKAIIWMHKRFEANDPAVWGQKKEECIEDLPIGDDSILDCARFFKEKEGHRTVLLSNDRNLSIKATVYGVKAISILGSLGKTADEIVDDLGLEAAKPSPAPFPAPAPLIELANDTNGWGSNQSDFSITWNSPAQSAVKNATAAAAPSVWNSLAPPAAKPVLSASVWNSPDQQSAQPTHAPPAASAWGFQQKVSKEEQWSVPNITDHAFELRNSKLVTIEPAQNTQVTSTPVGVTPIATAPSTPKASAPARRTQTLEDSRWGKIHENRGKLVQSTPSEPKIQASAITSSSAVAAPKVEDDAVFKAKLMDILNAVDHVVINHLSSMVIFFAKQSGHDITIENLADLEVATATFFPMGDPGAAHYLPGPFRQRLASNSYSEQASRWKEFCLSPDMANKPSEWDVRDWITDLTKLWKILYGPGLSDIDKKTINSIVTGWMANVSNAYA